MRMWGIRVGMREIMVGMRRIRVEMRGIMIIYLSIYLFICFTVFIYTLFTADSI